jgi:hypothetical protein
MIQQDFDAFSREYRRLSAALERYKQSPVELASKADAYFHVLKKYPLTAVIAKADQWLEREAKFPKPAEWAAVIVRRAVELPVLSQDDAKDYRRAELLGWEDTPCGCSDCLKAGVHEKPLRFVPIEGRDGAYRKATDPLLNRTVTAGHWAHGFELFRWYDARASFYNRCLELGLRGDVLKPTKAPKRPFSELMKLIFPERQRPEPSA